MREQGACLFRCCNIVQEVPHVRLRQADVFLHRWALQKEVNGHSVVPVECNLFNNACESECKNGPRIRQQEQTHTWVVLMLTSFMPRINILRHECLQARMRTGAALKMQVL